MLFHAHVLQQRIWNREILDAGKKFGAFLFKPLISFSFIWRIKIFSHFRNWIIASRTKGNLKIQRIKSEID